MKIFDFQPAEIFWVEADMRTADHMLALAFTVKEVSWLTGYGSIQQDDISLSTHKPAASGKAMGEAGIGK